MFPGGAPSIYPVAGWSAGQSASAPRSLRRFCLRLSLLGFSGGDSAQSPFPVDGDGELLRRPSLLEFLTSERVKVVAMIAMALALCNADRVVMSVAIVPMSAARGWTKSFAGVVQLLVIFPLGIPAVPLVGGALVDYYGGKIVMAWGVALWSFATFLTPWAADRSVWALLAMRALLGVAEGVALPSMNNMVLRWFPQTERSGAVGLAMAGFSLGSAIGLLLSPVIMSKAGVFGPFVIFGLFGFLWVLVWVSGTSAAPDSHPQISRYELEYILGDRQKTPAPQHEAKARASWLFPPIGRLLSRMPTWALILANAMHSWGFFVNLSWMPLYFNMIYRVDLRQAAWFSAVPWAVMAILGYSAGVISDMLIRGGLAATSTRKLMQSIGFIGPGIAILGLNASKGPFVASAWLTVAVGLSSFSHSGFLVNIQEIAPKYTGFCMVMDPRPYIGLGRMSNTAGTMAAIMGTVGAGLFVERMGSFRGFLMLTSLLYFLCALFWNVFATAELVDFDGDGQKVL
ncbi:unnamed protein product [Spirodela intermedia]|uniref:Major facilitator superfamily (MFS) profile domain-containing protein n=1 Tax=Spirodela intermedia TaxID=51605 RepID=A0A7I8JH34_SPIIN|nr:unnamed protein product [Spirodela intermedia]CAA6669444.1 unnamed protein product [Spirodela intermedia]